MSYNYNSTYRNYFYETGHTKTLLFVSYNMKVTAVSGKPPKIENKNGWKSTKAYASGDIAVEGDRRYTCISPNTGNQPSTSPTYWNDIGEELNTIITNDNIDKENFEYSMSINSAKNLCIGSCEAAGIKIRIKNDGRIVPLVSHENDSYEETIFNVYLYFDDNSDTLMYFGMFQCNKDEVTSDFKFRDITMYDQMSVLRDLDVYQWFTRFTEKYPNCTVKQLRDGLFEVLNTNNEEYAYIRMPIDQKSQSLVHDSSTYKYRLDEGATKLSAANLLEDICEINGVWGRFGRSLNSEGRVEFEYIELPTITSSYKVPTKDKITSNMRERYVKHDWYRTRVIGKISVYNAYSECIGWRAKGDINIYDEKHTKKIGEKAEYAIYDNKFFDEVRKGSESNDLSKFLDDILTKVENITYEPYEIRCIGDPVREPGDVIFIEGTDDEIADTDPRKEYTSFKSYIFNRTLKGIQVMKDEYSSTGDRRMPVFGDSSSSSAYSSGSTNGVYRPSSSSSFITANGEGEQLNIPELIRNWGFRLLEIPSAGVTFDKDTGIAKIFWQDPEDITDNKPVPSYWDGTLLVRSHEKPLNRWQEGVTVLDDFKTRNEHTTEETAYEDEHAGDYDIVYYGLFPYDVKGDYNPFKVLKVVTNNVIGVPKITDITEVASRSMKVNYLIPEGTYEYIRLVYKKNSEPGSVTDGTAINITGSGVNVAGLDVNTTYYFKIFLKGSNKAKSESKAVSAKTTNVDPYIMLDQSTRYIIPSALPVQVSDANAWKWNATEFQMEGHGWNGSQANFAFSTGFKKGNATKIYIDTECTSNGRYWNYNIYLWASKTMGYGWDYGNKLLFLQIINWDGNVHIHPEERGHSYLRREWIEVSLAGIDPNQVFYIGGYTNCTDIIIHGIKFDDAPLTYTVEGVFNYNGVGVSSMMEYSKWKQLTQGYSYQHFNFYDNNAYYGYYTYGNWYNVMTVNTVAINKSTTIAINVEVEIPTGATGPIQSGNLNHSEIGLFSSTNFSSADPSEWWNSGYLITQVSLTDYNRRVNYLNIEPWNTLPKTVVRIPITSSMPNQVYLGFYKCDCTMKITKIWLEKYL